MISEQKILALGFQIGSGWFDKESYYIHLPINKHATLTIFRDYETSEVYLDMDDYKMPIHNPEHLKLLVDFLNYQP